MSARPTWLALAAVLLSGAALAAPVDPAAAARVDGLLGSYRPVTVAEWRCDDAASGRLTDVQELQAPSDRQRSVEINDQAGPILRDEALTAQSAQIDQVSGATITWGAYQESLQAALDSAKQ